MKPKLIIENDPKEQDLRYILETETRRQALSRDEVTDLALQMVSSLRYSADQKSTSWG